MNQPAPISIDLNCDLGEQPEHIERDLALISIVSSINIACGGHAGDERSMRELAARARDRGVAIGAHPSYPDRANFGRVAMRMTPPQLEACVRDQVRSLAAVARQEGQPLSHVKAHGALYHETSSNPDLAEAFTRGALADDPTLRLVALSGSPALESWRRAGHRVAAEEFADRRYQPDASLVPRSQQDAVITDPAEAAAQAVKLALGESLRNLPRVRIRCDTICIHSDTPNVADVARAVRHALERAGIVIRAPRG